ncbi:hypothetical protein BS78_01G421200 [Paspalum vaginatum]|nr:hypothetical protein BS78_01G421200 [Paspalum vaginatum]KAJ1298004.1 hypothetical protein BS78_01G421200 [Paspalum vaginatum]KAJ1298005.1 hypothetical protein BS78_01G421200 [Paspalum vaginatum]
MAEPPPPTIAMGPAPGALGEPGGSSAERLHRVMEGNRICAELEEHMNIILFRDRPRPPARVPRREHQQQPQTLEEERLRLTSIEPGYLEDLATDHQLATECLRHYNFMYLDNEYEPAGEVTRYKAMAFAGVMAALWPVRSVLVSSPSFLLHGHSSSSCSLTEMVLIKLSHAPL